MEVKQEDFLAIDNFKLACDGVINGKFILSDLKIANLVNSFEGNEDICNIFARCLQGFNFDKEFAKAKMSNGLKGHSFKLPEDNKKLIAMVYCFLLDVYNKKIDFYVFVNTFFDGGEDNNTNIAYQNYCNQVIVPFRDSIVSELENKFSSPIDNVDTLKEKPNLDYSDLEQNGFKRLALIVDQILDTIETESKIKEKQKQELIIVLKGLKLAAEMENIALISSISIGLDYLIKKVRSARFFYQELQECLSLLY